MSLETNEVSVITSDKKTNLDNVEKCNDKTEEFVTNQQKMDEDELSIQPSPDSTSQMIPTATTPLTSSTISMSKQPRVVPFMCVVPTSIQGGNGAMSSQQIIVNANSQFVTTLNNKLSITKPSASMSSVVLTQTTANSKSPQIILQKSGELR